MIENKMAQLFPQKIKKRERIIPHYSFYYKSVILSASIFFHDPFSQHKVIANKACCCTSYDSSSHRIMLTPFHLDLEVTWGAGFCVALQELGKGELA